VYTDELHTCISIYAFPTLRELPIVTNAVKPNKLQLVIINPFQTKSETD